MPTAIDPTAIPGGDVYPDLIDIYATSVSGIATDVRDHGSNVGLKWQAMAGVYTAPESGTVLGLMEPVSAQSTSVGDNLDVVAAALTQFAADVRPIKAALDGLRGDAQDFRARIAGGVSVRELNPAWASTQGYQGSWNAYGAYSSPSVGGDAAASGVSQYRTVTKEWHEVQEYVDENNDLLGRVNAQQVLLWEAERDCANKIRALFGGAALRSAQSENDALGYGLDAIPEGTEMPWGAPVERTEGCGEATVNFVFRDFLWEGIAVGGVWGTIQGLGTLVLGYNPATGDWFSGEAYGAAWGNLGMLAAGVAISATPPLNLVFMADDVAQQFGGGFLPDEVRDFKDSTDEAWLNTGKGLIAWDTWQDDPGAALGESFFNVATVLIPVGGAAVAGVKTASTAASVVSKMVRVVDFVDPGAWAVNGATRLGGAGIGSLDNLIGRVRTTDAPEIEVYTATDSASALQTLDDWGVDMNAVSAGVRDGVPVLEFPGGRVELPAGAFDGAAGGTRVGDEGASIATPVREPGLVSAGGVRGETGPGVVNSIVEDAPVRTETGGSGSDGSTVVRESDRPDAGRDSPSSYDGGTPRSDAGLGDGVPARDGAEPSDGSAELEVVADPTDATTVPASVGQGISDGELQLMVDNGYHSSVFGDQIAPLYDRDGATLGGPNSNVWAMPTEDAAQIHSVAQAARETGMAKTVQDAYVNGGDVYAVHFPVDPSVLRRPTLADSGGWPHFYEDPTNTGPTYGHTAVSTGDGSFLLNQTRETLVRGGAAVPNGSVLTRLQDGSWVVVRRY